MIVDRKKKEKKMQKREKEKMLNFQCVRIGSRVLFHIFGFIYI